MSHRSRRRGLRAGAVLGGVLWILALPFYGSAQGPSGPAVPGARAGGPGSAIYGGHLPPRSAEANGNSRRSGPGRFPQIPPAS